VSEPRPEQKADIAATLGLNRPGGDAPRVQRPVLWIVIAVVVILFGLRLASRRDSGAVQYETQPAVRGELVVHVSATGNLEPRRKVDVGSELSGTIRSVEVDFNDRVTVGQVIARLDTTRLDAQVSQAEASLEAAKARLLLSKATVEEATSHSARLEKLHTLSGGEMPAESDMDSAAGALARAKADETASEAAIAQWEATLAAYQTDRSKMEIKSPIDGIVLRCAVQPGQTVAATFQSPILFTLAEDLAKLDLVVDVDEADVGKVGENQTATFTVDAYPDRAFPARTTQVRYGSQALDGVVTYKTVLEVDNSDLVLRPGMTATAVILIEKRANALLVPNAALRFTPPAATTTARRRSLVGAFLPKPPPIDQRPVSAGGTAQRVYTLVKGRPNPVDISKGASDGVMTEIVAGDLKEGSSVITDLASASR
jgi:HlyD family secretion protein